MESKICTCFGIEHPAQAEHVTVGSCKCSRIWAARWIGSVCPVCDRRIHEQHLRCYGYAPGASAQASETPDKDKAPEPAVVVTPNLNP